MVKIKILRRFDINSLTSGCYSFLNLASISSLSNSRSSGINYFCDGMLLAFLVSLLKFKKIQRVSFDFTSIANCVLNHASDNGLSVYFVGATQEEIDSFSKKISIRYPKINILGTTNGYFGEVNEISVIESIVNLNPNIVIASLGAGKQEDFIKKIYNRVPGTILFTCGGFIRQESGKKSDYYPVIVNKLKLRAFYRMLKEPHTIRRYFLDYPRNAVKVIFSREIKIEIE